MSSSASITSRLRRGEPTLGTFLSLGTPLAAEICAGAGFDWVLLDLEHGAGTESELIPTAQAVAGRCALLVRVEQNERPRVQRALDAGADGVMVPRIDSVEQARATVSHLRYPPVGDRGVAYMNRAADFGAGAGVQREVLCVLQVETAGALEHVDELAATDGVDVLFVGPADLGAAIGAAAVAEASDRVLDACEAAGKAAGLFTRERAEAERALARGFRFVALASDAYFLAEAARAAGGLHGAATGSGSAEPPGFREPPPQVGRRGQAAVRPAPSDKGLVVATGPVHPIAEEILGPIVVGDWRARLADVEVLVVRGDARVTAADIAAASRLRVIGRCGVGFDNVDVEAARARGIPVVVTPGANARAVAEGALVLVLALLKRLPELHRAVRAGEWAFRDSALLPDVAGSTVGIVGYGRIGRELGDLARGVGMHVLAHDPNVEGAAVPLDAVFENSDAVSLHVPLTDETRGLVGPALLARAKPGLILVNTARGGLISSLDDLLAALEDGRLGGVGLDVFDEEPPDASHPLFAHPRVLVSPHAVGLTVGAREAVFREMAEGVAAVLRGDPPPHAA